MKLETLKRNNKKKILIGGLITLGLVSVIGFTTTRAKYRSTQSLKLATGSVNWKQYDFKIMAMKQSEDGVTYEDVDTMPESDYVVNEEKTYCTTDNKTQTKGKIKTVSGIHGIYNLTKNEKCYIWFDKKTTETINTPFGPITAKLIVPDFTKVATTDEGIFETDDPMYKTTGNPNPKAYYWRGAVTNNYVQFAEFCWRIVRINGDGTIRMIYDGTSCHANGTTTVESIAESSKKYNNSYNNSSYVGWTYTIGKQRPSETDSTSVGESSNIKLVTDEWYESNITGTKTNRVAEGKFCNDRRTKNNETWRATGDTQFYAIDQRIASGTKTPSLDCLTGDIYTLKVGAIAADEVQFAGASWTTTNKNYYLYNGQTYWTMSPYNWGSGSAAVFAVDTNGYLNGTSVHNTHGIRPVINLKADVTISSGDGTQGSPYIVQ